MCPGAYIYHFLKAQVLLQYEWGFTAPSYGFDYFSFKVHGAAFQGTVKIKTKEFSNTFTVIFLDAFEENEIRRVRNVHEDDLVEVLNAHIDGSNSWNIIKELYLYESSNSHERQENMVHY